MARKKKSTPTAIQEDTVFTQQELLNHGLVAWSQKQLLDPDMLKQVTDRTRSTQQENLFRITTPKELIALAQLFGCAYPSTRENKTSAEIQAEALEKGIGADKVVKYKSTFPCNEEMFEDWSAMLHRVITHSSKLFDTQDASTLWKNTPFVRPEEWDLAYNVSRGVHVLTSDCAPIINRTKLWISTFEYQGKKTSFGLLLKDRHPDAIQALTLLHPYSKAWFENALRDLETKTWPLPEKVTLWPLPDGTYKALSPIPSAGGLVHHYQHNQALWKKIHDQNERLEKDPDGKRIFYRTLERITVGGTKPENAGSAMKDCGAFFCYVRPPHNMPKIHRQARFRYFSSSFDGHTDTLKANVQKLPVLAVWPNGLLERKLYGYSCELIEQMTQSIRSLPYDELFSLYQPDDPQYSTSHPLLLWALGFADEDDVLEVRNHISSMTDFHTKHARANDMLLQAVKELMPPKESQ